MDPTGGPTRHFAAGALPVLSMGHVVLHDGLPVPAVLLDTSGRPDVADLARVASTEGVGDLRCGLGVWDLGSPEDWLVRIEAVVDHPVRCRFHLCVLWHESQEWLGDIAAHGMLTVGTGDGSGPWLALNVDPGRLAPVLADLARRNASAQTDGRPPDSGESAP